MVDDTKKGPVRPPILDAEAKSKSNSTDNGKSPNAEKPAPSPQADSSTKKPEPTKNDRPAAASKQAPQNGNDEGGGLGMFIMVVALSAVLGAAGAAGLAYFKIFPFNQWAEQSSLSPELAKLQKRIFDLENAQGPDLSILATKAELNDIKSAVGSIDTQKLQTAIAANQNKIAELAAQSQSETDSPVDLSPLADQIATLQTELTRLQTAQSELANQSNSTENTDAGPAPAPVDLTPLEQQLEAQQQTLAEVQADLAQQSGQATDLAAELTQLQAQLKALEEDQSASDAAADALAAARVPLLMSEVDAALVKGAPFATPLQEISTFLNISPSDEIAQLAETGITPRAALTNKFAELRPDILAARPGMPDDAPWQDKIMGAVKDAVNLRPLGAQSDDPLVLIDQIELALNQNELEKARSLLQQLPDPMQRAAESLTELIQNHIQVDDWQRQMRNDLLGQNKVSDEGENQ